MGGAVSKGSPNIQMDIRGAVSKGSAHTFVCVREDSRRAVDEIVDTVIVDRIEDVELGMIAEAVALIVHDEAPTGAADREAYFTEVSQRLTILLATLVVAKVAPDEGVS